MLSIIPYERAQQQRQSERPFKSYPRAHQLPVTPPSAHHNSAAYFNPFAPSGIIGSLHAVPPGYSPHHSKQEAPMDLRPQSSMYDGRDGQYGGEPSNPYMDLSSHIPNRIPNIKSEHHTPSSLAHSIYPNVNTNPAHTNGYNPTGLPMPITNLRDISPTSQASLPNMGAVNSGATAMTPDMNNLDSRQPHTYSPPGGDTSHSHSTPMNSNPSALGSHPDRHNLSPHAPRTPHSDSTSPVQFNGGSPNSEESDSNKRPLQQVPEDMKDRAYWDKRKKNNESAKRSREARRMKEEQIAMRVVYLEQDNLQLRTEVSLLKSEIEKLRCMLYNT